MTADEHALAWQAQSLLLDYPDEELLHRLPLLRKVSTAVPGPVGQPLATFLEHVLRTPLMDLASDYVETFDHRKRGSLYLTYYTYGDTRKRGMALLRFTHAYRAAGLDLAPGELPDHLAVVLEFAAGHPEAGSRLMCEHRAGLELLRLGLREAGSPWARVLDSVAATLPRLRGREEDALARLIAEGPPEEEVGLEPFGGLR
ncbi:nitrate reductase molybdenum cofactor assembly chaperone [Amycolatopsis sp. K13G38]|uniref:Nitrate reductase molybdenum cofactor assembly chaperone n=1 Tax=Amycolatopsis acididurans TaxID=2724524 RepID=A0ABX1JHQ8_9PSEU|nr:nitrate reductase molybdenum cofactor assembly chaperone [Amycolatopsis acididurans]NKQ57772.1 nitrate reductase molybdenum cofactor assembly chaperone [Amycolatopsis acididurans]